MILRSGDNLLEKVKEFVKVSKEVVIYSPFIKTSKLKEIIREGNCESIVVRWQANDILSGACDFESLFKFCNENGIKLYRNTRMHLKVIEDYKGRILFGSANISNRGMGDKNFNYELSGVVDKITLKERVYLDKIIFQSDFVDERYFQKMKEKIDKIRLVYDHKEYNLELELNEEDAKDSKFLLSALPMTSSPNMLWEIYSQNGLGFNEEEISCAAHDLANYEVGENINQEDFEKQLKNNFNKHPFIISLKEAIKVERRNSMNYGNVVRWIQQNTKTVPTPLSWEVKKKRIVNNLYSWICHFDSNYSWSIPGRKTEVIYYQK